MAIPPIQGSGDECRSCRTSCIDRGMAYPSDFAAGSTTRSVAVPAQPVGRWWHRSTSLRSGCLHNGMHIAKTGSLWRHRITNHGPARRYD
jgi:deoxycytidine triphosphate deaminase